MALLLSRRILALLSYRRRGKTVEGVEMWRAEVVISPLQELFRSSFNRNRLTLRKVFAGTATVLAASVLSTGHGGRLGLPSGPLRGGRARAPRRYAHGARWGRLGGWPSGFDPATNTAIGDSQLLDAIYGELF